MAFNEWITKMERHLSRSCLLKGEQPIFHRNSPPPALNRKSITRGRERPVIHDMTHTHARVCRRIQGKVPSPRSSPCESSSNSENELLSREGARRTRRTVSRAEATPTGRRSRNETERNETTRVLPAPGTVRLPANPEISHHLPFSPELRNLFFLYPLTVLRHFHEPHQDHRLERRRILLHTSLEEMRIINHVPTALIHHGHVLLRSIGIRGNLRVVWYTMGRECRV